MPTGAALSQVISVTLIVLAQIVVLCVMAILSWKRRDVASRMLLASVAAALVLQSSLAVESILRPSAAIALALVLRPIATVFWVGAAIMTVRMLPRWLRLPTRNQIIEANDALLKSEQRLLRVQKLDAMGKLTGGIAHDFNNLLQSMNTSIELAERACKTGDTEKMSMQFGILRRGIERGAALVHRLLAFARKRRMDPVPLGVGSALAAMHEMLRVTVGPGISVEYDIRTNWIALCDESDLDSAVLNLCINARDAMPGGGTIKVAARDVQLSPDTVPRREPVPAGDYIEISVSDNGSGMPPETVARAFEPFYTTKRSEGTGLGLAQVETFAQSEKGFASIESVVGLGTTVRIFLPRYGTEVLAPAIVPPMRVTLDPSEHAGKFKGTVLLVDDEEDVRRPIGDMLREIGFMVVEADNGKAALHTATEGGFKPDLLVTDIGMPHMNGRELVAAIRAKMPRLPIVVITGYAGAEGPSLPVGSDLRVLSKPFALATLAATVTELTE